jgi:hypothetical protein
MRIEMRMMRKLGPDAQRIDYCGKRSTFASFEIPGPGFDRADRRMGRYERRSTAGVKGPHMARVFVGLCLAATLVWMTACSDDDKKKTNHNAICTEDTNCSDPFFECEHISTTTTGTCTKPCEDDSECPSNHSCLTNPDIGLEPSCLQLCSSEACPSGHNCIRSTSGIMFCVPSAWTTS